MLSLLPALPATGINDIGGGHVVPPAYTGATGISALAVRKQIGEALVEAGYPCPLSPRSSAPTAVPKARDAVAVSIHHHCQTHDQQPARAASVVSAVSLGQAPP
jgi:hypothetical protein